MSQPEITLMSEKEAARVLGLHWTTLRDYRRAGKISSYTIDRRPIYAPHHIADYIQRRNERRTAAN